MRGKKKHFLHYPLLSAKFFVFTNGTRKRRDGEVMISGRKTKRKLNEYEAYVLLYTYSTLSHLRVILPTLIETADGCYLWIKRTTTSNSLSPSS
jgi:hypothetical protein